MGSTDESYSNTGYEPKDYFLTETYVESLTESMTEQRFSEQRFLEDVMPQSVRCSSMHTLRFPFEFVMALGWAHFVFHRTFEIRPLAVLNARPTVLAVVQDPWSISNEHKGSGGGLKLRSTRAIGFEEGCTRNRTLPSPSCTHVNASGHDNPTLDVS